ncbi:hypothetical protein PRZ48_000790 [Zasmidium cellare]|uniref:Uncharacterized protein n=1 Tax=Zasmidium cellare TaxID=395010 RepID=A0ABR0F0Z3_ZASCE|nr:hypothetical protein PRZ48_000790 [Zasmidium cellare]
MAPSTFALISLGSHGVDSLLASLKSPPIKDQLLWVGKCHHWVHQPHLSSAALNGTGPLLQKWDYLIVTKLLNQDAFATLAEKTWSVTAEVSDDLIASLPESKKTREATEVAPLPAGWSPSDHSGLDAAVSPPDLEASLAMTSHAMGSPPDSSPIALKDFLRTFGTSHPGPIAMFNLLSYLPEQRPRYFQYMAAFQESVGIKYGGQPVVIGLGVLDWSSREQEKGQEGDWEDTAVIWYPSLWHFGKMFDDEGYMEVDRKFKVGVIRDNPLLCCTEVELE